MTLHIALISTTLVTTYPLLDVVVRLVVGLLISRSTALYQRRSLFKGLLIIQLFRVEVPLEESYRHSNASMHDRFAFATRRSSHMVILLGVQNYSCIIMALPFSTENRDRFSLYLPVLIVETPDHCHAFCQKMSGSYWTQCSYLGDTHKQFEREHRKEKR